MSLCAICKKAVTRWRCNVCPEGVPICRSDACVRTHESACKPTPDPETTVGLLELAFRNEPFRICSARPRCPACEKHDAVRDKIEAALKAAREFKA